MMAGGYGMEIAAVLLGYLLGSIPFGLILTRLGGAGDLRAIGSGNIGATNVLRTGRKGLAAATLLLDGGKGFAAVWVARALWGDVPSGGDPILLAGLAALVGHCFPVWLRGRGGKGVATMLGIGFGFDWRIGLASAVTWAIVARVTRVSSLGGMASAVAAPLAALVWRALIDPAGGGFSGEVARAALAEVGVVLALMALLVVFQHRANIARLRAGTEPRIGAKPG